MASILKVNPSKQGRYSNQNKDHLGSRCTYNSMCPTTLGHPSQPWVILQMFATRTRLVVAWRLASWATIDTAHLTWIPKMYGFLKGLQLGGGLKS